MKFKLIAGILLIVITLGIYTAKAFLQNSSQQQNGDIVIEETLTGIENQGDGAVNTEGSTGEAIQIVVDVGGSVKNPGVIKLPLNSRVIDAVVLAGGLSEPADTKRVNLAAILSDGEKIYIPSINEVLEESSGEGESGLVNINTANSETLQKINGVGPSTAEKIISYRTSNGQFKKIEELMNISGIGEKTFAKFKNQITVN